MAGINDSTRKTGKTPTKKVPLMSFDDATKPFAFNYSNEFNKVNNNNESRINGKSELKSSLTSKSKSISSHYDLDGKNIFGARLKLGAIEKEYADIENGVVNNGIYSSKIIPSSTTVKKRSSMNDAIKKDVCEPDIIKNPQRSSSSYSYSESKLVHNKIHLTKGDLDNLENSNDVNYTSQNKSISPPTSPFVYNRIPIETSTTKTKNFSPQSYRNINDSYQKEDDLFHDDEKNSNNNYDDEVKEEVIILNRPRSRPYMISGQQNKMKEKITGLRIDTQFDQAFNNVNIKKRASLNSVPSASALHDNTWKDLDGGLSPCTNKQKQVAETPIANSPYNFVNPKIKHDTASTLPTEYAIGILPNIKTSGLIKHSNDGTETPVNLRRMSSLGAKSTTEIGQKRPKSVSVSTNSGNKKIEEGDLGLKDLVRKTAAKQNQLTINNMKQVQEKIEKVQSQPQLDPLNKQFKVDYENKPFYNQFDWNSINHISGKCDICHKTLDSSYFTTKKGDVTLTICSDICYEKTLPICTVCGKNYNQNGQTMMGLGDGNKISVCSKKCCDIIALYHGGKDYGIIMPLCYMCKGACISFDCKQVAYHLIVDKASATKRMLCFNCMSKKEVHFMTSEYDDLDFSKTTPKFIKCTCCQLYYKNDPNLRIEVENTGIIKRFLCNNCIRKNLALTDVSKITEIYNDVKNKLIVNCGLNFSPDIPLIVCSKQELVLQREKGTPVVDKINENTRKKVIHSHEQGFHLFNMKTNSLLVGSKVVKKTVEVSCSIYILNYLCETVTRDILAHELAHNYCKLYIENRQGSHPLTLSAKELEGFAEFVAACYNFYEGNKWINSLKEKNEDPVYGDGYRLMKTISKNEKQVKDKIECIAEYLRRTHLKD